MNNAAKQGNIATKSGSSLDAMSSREALLAAVERYCFLTID
ncbi:MAG TPA: hypothetical protein VGT79_07010 [Xanthomonadaceae bacterium]|nr:hypothetical protein [Xanthomonadaceae bacterium]